MPKGATSSLATGVYAALATPRRRDSIDADTAAYLEYLDKVSAAGVSGLVFFGSTGEFIHFDAAERMRVVGLAVKRSRLPVLVNVSHSTFSGMRDLADHAIDSGAHGLMVMPPYFYRYSDADIESFYRAVVSAVAQRLPIYLYNLPLFTTPISSVLLERLLESGAFAGIKDSSGEWEIFEHLRGIRERAGFQLLAGHERIYARAFRAGADGVVSGVAAAIPELPVAIQRAVEARDSILTEDLARRMEEFLQWVERFPTTVIIKEAADVRRWIRSTVAVPLNSSATEQLVAFRGWFEAWLPETLALSARAAGGKPVTGL